MEDIISLFHHIHHQKRKHIVHHCGGDHKKINPKLNYVIYHCNCGKHKINKQKAIGHNFDLTEIKVVFNEKCPQGGWHIESGFIKN